jgi:ABC-2 type transport system permease protein
MFNIWLVHFAWPARCAFATETMKSSIHAIASVAYKEFLHIYRDRRVLLLLLILPPLFTLLFGHAFETSEISDVPAMLINRDNNARTQRFIDIVLQNKTFRWRQAPPEITNESDLLANRVQATLVIPQAWSDSLSAGNPKPLTLYLDGSDINTASAAEGGVQKSLADFQVKERDLIVENLPDEVIELGKKLPVQIRKQFVSLMEAWSAESKILYNPKSRFIDYVIPGIIGLILQLLTVTLMACTIARERESGTLYQLLVTSLKRGEIVIGKILPYLGVSIVLIAVITLVAAFHFHVQFYQPPALILICLLFLLCSLGLGLLISAFSKTQTQAIQFSVFFLLPVFVLSGAFAPLEQLPQVIQYLSEVFPLTHFCRAFRLVNMYHAGPEFYLVDLVVLFAGALVTFIGAAFLLRRIEE